jgi:predicted dinucleotide-binding enzyme
VLGPGRVGRVIAARLESRGHHVHLGRDAELARGCDVVFLCVPDRAIAEVAARLPEAARTGPSGSPDGP